MRFISVRELRNAPSEVWDALEQEDLVLTSNGRPKAVLVRVEGDDLERTVQVIRRARAQAAVSRLLDDLDGAAQREVDRPAQRRAVARDVHVRAAHAPHEVRADRNDAGVGIRSCERNGLGHRLRLCVEGPNSSGNSTARHRRVSSSTDHRIASVHHRRSGDVHDAAYSGVHGGIEHHTRAIDVDGAVVVPSAHHTYLRCRMHHGVEASERFGEHPGRRQVEGGARATPERHGVMTGAEPPAHFQLLDGQVMVLEPVPSCTKYTT